MPAVEIAILIISTVGSWSDVLLSTFNLCMQGTCRSECCCMEIQHEDSEAVARRTSSNDPTEVTFTKELKE